MKDARVVEILTPKKVRLNGLWFGPRRAGRVVIWIHGLGSSAFSKLDIVTHLTDARTAVLTFNNRGSGTVSRVLKGKKSFTGGAAFEVFTECIDDIEGAIRLAKENGAKEIFLVGHSTGCQKSVYWAAQKGKGVKAIVLLAPISDYTGTQQSVTHSAALKEARRLVQRGEGASLVRSAGYVISAQRYISLFSGEGPEEVFPYWDADRLPKTLWSVKIPLLILLAEKDEYADRPARTMQDWFAEHIKVGDQIHVVAKADHSFKGSESLVARTIRDWMDAQ